MIACSLSKPASQDDGWITTCSCVFECKEESQNLLHNYSLPEHIAIYIAYINTQYSKLRSDLRPNVWTNRGVGGPGLGGDPYPGILDSFCGAKQFKTRLASQRVRTQAICQRGAKRVRTI